MDKYQELVDLVDSKFGNDRTAPSVVLALVKGKGYYCAVARYTQPYAKGKYNVCAEFGTTLMEAVDNARAKVDATV